jgi:hypothetical protein
MCGCGRLARRRALAQECGHGRGSVLSVILRSDSSSPAARLSPHVQRLSKLHDEVAVEGVPITQREWGGRSGILCTEFSWVSVKLSFRGSASRSTPDSASVWSNYGPGKLRVIGLTAGGGQSDAAAQNDLLGSPFLQLLSSQGGPNQCLLPGAAESSIGAG